MKQTQKLAWVLALWPGWAWNHAGFLGSAGTCPRLQTWECHTWISERNPCQVPFPPENRSTHPTKSYFSILEVPEASIIETQGNTRLKMVWPSLCSWLAVGTFHPLASASPTFRAMQLPGAPVTPQHPTFALSSIIPGRHDHSGTPHFLYHPSLLGDKGTKHLFGLSKECPGCLCRELAATSGKLSDHWCQQPCPI